jgi:hypothetical protein
VYLSHNNTVDFEMLECVGGLRNCWLNAVLSDLPIHGGFIVCAKNTETLLLARKQVAIVGNLFNP